MAMTAAQARQLLANPGALKQTLLMKPEAVRQAYAALYQPGTPEYQAGMASVDQAEYDNTHGLGATVGRIAKPLGIAAIGLAGAGALGLGPLAAGSSALPAAPTIMGPDEALAGTIADRGGSTLGTALTNAGVSAATNAATGGGSHGLLGTGITLHDVTQAAPYVLGGIGALQANSNQNAANDLRQEALDLARQEYAAKAPLRERALSLLTGPMPTAPDLSGLRDTRNPYTADVAQRLRGASPVGGTAVSTSPAPVTVPRQLPQLPSVPGRRGVR
jgi:hypothetical protein